MEADSSASQDLCPPALKALLHNLIDYAGIFPPAQLPLSDALHNFSRYRQHVHAWMLGRFVLPVGRIEDLDAFSNLYRVNPPFELSILGSGGSSGAEFRTAFEADIDAIQDLHERHNDRVRTDVMEVPLPTALLDAERSDVTRFLDELHTSLVMNGLSKLDIFFEIPVNAHSERRLPVLLNAMVDCNEKHHTPLRMGIGCKFRLGGEGPDAIPQCQYLAQSIGLCELHSVRFKATAGLHHPLRHLDTETERHMHGFFNVFGAATLAIAETAQTDLLTEILKDENADHFRFDNEAFHWKSISVPIETIIATRQDFAISFGSCSFDESRENLQYMGLL